MGSGFMFYKVFKRLLDIFLSFMGLLLLSPIFLIII
ncbi:sugar transferase, partial [Francisella tularensis subsp. holarctica]|nr:sugar transferase [Francisella tularensis subsp. holarctica]